MSQKQQDDKTAPGYPRTSRQRRLLRGRRLARKQGHPKHRLGLFPVKAPKVSAARQEQSTKPTFPAEPSEQAPA